MKSKTLVRDESGATAIEYSLMASAIALVIIAAVIAVGNDVVGMFAAVADGFS